MIRMNLSFWRIGACTASAAALACIGSSRADAGILYAADGALSTAGNLYTVDSNTGLTTTVGALVDAAGAITSIGQFRDASTLQFNRYIDAIAVPAPGAFTMLGLAGMLGARRRR